MNVQLWIIFFLFLINSISQAAVVDQPRKPIDRPTAVVLAIINLIFAGLVLWGGLSSRG